ncbi:MAG: hypothetical protein MUE81_19345, partial [Thermoflexibacter sp.]|nr:hypothetical protein [Thermoflexibacter sp.]
MLITEEKVKTVKARKIPTALIYEVIDGKPVYRKGYKDVLNKKKTSEEIRGSSSLQAILIGLITKFLFKNLPDEYMVGGA